MAAPDRVITQTGAGPSVSGSIQDELTGLWNEADVHLTDIGGTADAIEATLVPALTAGLTAGMKFSFIAAETNTGAATIAINGGSAIDITDDDGNALASGLIVAGRLHKIESDGTSLRLLGGADIQKVNNVQTFTASGTWTKPAGTPDDAVVWVYAIGGGAGGDNETAAAGGGGAGGGGFGSGWVPFRAGDLASTVSVTVGAGGAIQTAGGNTSFGSHLIAYGGGASIFYPGGAGGGPYGAGGSSSTSQPGTVDGDGGDGGAAGLAGKNAIYGGGGGGGSGGSTGGAGGNSIWGGGGGGADGSSTNGAAGRSKFAGAGGTDQIAGTIPGGGGGARAAGARGQLTVHTVG